MKQMTYEAFDFFLQGPIDLKTATYAQLEEILHNAYQLGGDVARKCIKFFIALANDAGIPLSPFVTKKSGTARASTGTRRATKKGTVRTNKKPSIPITTKEIPNGRFSDNMLLTKFPTFDPTWSDEVKLKWFEAFDQLLKRIFASGNER